jgi:hypothetical protein
VELELLEHLFLDDGADAITKQRAVGHDHRSTATTCNRYAHGACGRAAGMSDSSGS